MKSNTEKAKKILKSENLTCVFCRSNEVIKCSERGVKPLLKLIDENKNLDGFCVADKVIGSAAAYLYTILHPDEIYAPVMSENAVKILQDAKIASYYDTCAAMIFNRQNTGICPMENAVKECNTAKQALSSIKEAVKKLK